MNAAGFQIWTNKWQSLWCCLMQLWQWLTPSHWSQCWSNIHKGSKSWSLGELTASKPGKTNGRYYKLCQFWFVFCYSDILDFTRHGGEVIVPYWKANIGKNVACQNISSYIDPQTSMQGMNVKERKEGEQHFAAFIVLKSSQSILFLTSLLHWQCELQ